MALLQVAFCYNIHKSIFSLLKEYLIKVKTILAERASPGFFFDKKLLYV